MPFSALAEGSFIGRDRALADLALLAVRPGRPRSQLISGPHGVGKTELLRQLYTLLFWKQGTVTPFLYTVQVPFMTCTLPLHARSFPIVAWTILR